LYNPSSEVKDVDEKLYYGDRLHTSLPNNTPYSKIEASVFRTFKVIQIVNENEVIEKISFTHSHLGFGTY